MASNFGENSFEINALKIFKKLRDAHNMVDVLIKTTGENTIHAHAVVLASRIPYFNTFFTNKNPKDFEKISFPTFDERVVELVINYAYTGEILISLENVVEILQFSQLLGVSVVVNWCSVFIRKNLTVDNFQFFWNLGKQDGMESMQKVCLEMMTETFESFVQTSCFPLVDFDNLISVLNDDSLNVSQEEIVISGIQKWIDATPSISTSNILELISTVRWNFVKETGSIASLLFSTSVYDGNEETKNILQNKIKQIDAPQQLNNFFQSYNHNARLSYKINKSQQNILIVRNLCSKIEHYVEIFDEKSQTTTVLGKMNGQFDSSFVCLNDKILKTRSSACGTSAIVFDLKLKQTLLPLMADMKYSRSQAAAVNISLTDLIISGSNFKDTMCTCEAYNILLNTWTPLNNMQTGRYNHASVCLPDKSVYVLGGSDNYNNALSSVERIRFGMQSNKKWEYMAPMSVARQSFAASQVGSKIIVAGGLKNQNIYETSVELYTPSLDYMGIGSWSFITPMNKPFEVRSILSLNDHFLVFGSKGEIERCDFTEKKENNSSKECANFEWVSSWTLTDTERFHCAFLCN